MAASTAGSTIALSYPNGTKTVVRPMKFRTKRVATQMDWLSSPLGLRKQNIRSDAPRGRHVNRASSNSGSAPCSARPIESRATNHWQVSPRSSTISTTTAYGSLSDQDRWICRCLMWSPSIRPTNRHATRSAVTELGCAEMRSPMPRQRSRVARTQRQRSS